MGMFKNPIILNSEKHNTSDPYVVLHDGWYYHCYAKENNVFVAKVKHLDELETAEAVCVYSEKRERRSSRDSWFAPELHLIDGVWYIYGAPQTAVVGLGPDELGTHTMCVLKNENSDPQTPFENLGVVKGLEGTWSIDGTVFTHDEKLWFLWTEGADIYLAEMQDAVSIKKPYVHLTHPELPFECRSNSVNEGPAVLKRNGKIHVVYSANDSNDDYYCLGLLTYSGGNILDKKNWKKHQDSVLEMTDSVFGPGHCSFTKVKNGDEMVDCIVFHANLESGTGQRGRSVWAQTFTWDEEDFPVFGKPEAPQRTK